MLVGEAASSAGDAVSKAASFGYPVALKGCASNLAHKTEFGLVRLSLTDGPEAETAYNELSDILDRNKADGATREIVVQPMAPGGIELIIAVRNDPAFGLVVVAGLGGIFVEFLKSAAIRLGPVDEETALQMLEDCRASEMLTGLRGRGPFDAAAAARAIAALSRFGEATLEVLGSLEINPLIVGENGAFGVDALFVPASRHAT
jgi:hypothetical protein